MNCFRRETRKGLENVQGWRKGDILRIHSVYFYKDKWYGEDTWGRKHELRKLKPVDHGEVINLTTGE
jgi:hypothetical protein